MRISDWSSDVCSSDLAAQHFVPAITQTKIQRQAVSDLVSDLPKQCCVRIDSMRCGVLGRARSGKCYEVRTTRRFGPVVIIKAANDEIEPIVEQSAENLEFICQIAALGIRCGGKQREGNANPRRDGKEQRPITTGVDRLPVG